MSHECHECMQFCCECPPKPSAVSTTGALTPEALERLRAWEFDGQDVEDFRALLAAYEQAHGLLSSMEFDYLNNNKVSGVSGLEYVESRRNTTGPYEGLLTCKYPLESEAVMNDEMKAAVAMNDNGGE